MTDTASRADDDPHLGPFAAGVRVWSKMIATAEPDLRPKVFRNCIAEGATFVRKGAPRGLIISELIERAERHEMLDALGGREAVEKIVAEGLADTSDRTPRQKKLKPDQRLIVSSAQFVSGFVPPDYVIEGILQRRFLYSLTGKTGAGKTAILLLIAAHVAEGRKIGERDVEQGRVLYFAGENADDVRMRWIAFSQQMGFDPGIIGVQFIPGVFKISEMQKRIRAELTQIGDVSLIIVDTAAAYFEGDDENSNTQFGDYARRTLRPLTTMPGEPCVIVACHPVKHANDDNLIPRGGGSFLNEMDGNQTATLASGVVELHWQGKYRGPDFAPIHFTLRTVTHERLKDSKGRLTPTVVASPLSEQGHADITQAAQSHEDDLMVALLDPINCTATQIELARRLGWKMRDGQPYHVLVRRILKALEKAKLVTVARGRMTLTKKGKTTAESCLNKRVQTDPHGTDFVQTPEHP